MVLKEEWAESRLLDCARQLRAAKVAARHQRARVTLTPGLSYTFVP